MNKLTSFLLAYSAYVVAVNVIDGPWRHWRKGGVVDGWTLTHVAWGALAKRWGLSERELVWLTLANEAGEAVIRRYRPDLTWGSPETPANILADLVTTWAGWKAT